MSDIYFLMINKSILSFSEKQIMLANIFPFQFYFHPLKETVCCVFSEIIFFQSWARSFFYPFIFQPWDKRIELAKRWKPTRSAVACILLIRRSFNCRNSPYLYNCFIFIDTSSHHIIHYSDSTRTILSVPYFGLSVHLPY